MAAHLKRFSIGRFLLLVILQFSLLLVSFKLVFPETWEMQIAAGPWQLIWSFLGMHMFNALFEWGFHRYFLHRAPWSLVKHLARDHGRHHKLTRIKLLPSNPALGPGRIVLNRYPITEPEQYESSAFPWYALIVFWVGFTPPLIAVQVLLPHAPILLGGYSAITWSMISYEVFHAIEHFPYEWWKSAVEHKHFGWIWQKVYGFHHFHHANVHVNEAIGGFFGLPIFDWIFGTLHIPKRLLLEGREATADEFEIKPPRKFVDWLDKLAA